MNNNVLISHLLQAVGDRFVRHKTHTNTATKADNDQTPALCYNTHFSPFPRMHYTLAKMMWLIL